MAEKQKTLRPEIQLLNNLIAATDASQRDEVRALTYNIAVIVYYC